MGLLCQISVISFKSKRSSEPTYDDTKIHVALWVNNYMFLPLVEATNLECTHESIEHKALAFDLKESNTGDTLLFLFIILCFFFYNVFERFSVLMVFKNIFTRFHKALPPAKYCILQLLIFNTSNWISDQIPLIFVESLRKLLSRVN